MKKYLLMLFFLILPLFSFAQRQADVPNSGSYGMHPADDIYFLPENGIRFSFLEPTVEKTGVYTIDISKGIPFVDVIWEDKTKERLLILSNENILEVYNSSGVLFKGIEGRQLPGGAEVWLVPYSDNITASSYLIEGAISYAPKERERPIFQPLWVEGADGHGIHEKLFIKAKTCYAIHISIGYVSYFKPDLYYENSRPKQIRLTVKNKFSFDVDLEDTPNYQTIKLPIPLKADDILELEILEVYPGTKYTDTCINCIYYDYFLWQDETLKPPYYK